MPDDTLIAAGHYPTIAGIIYWIMIRDKLALLCFSSRHYRKACSLVLQTNADASPNATPKILRDQIDSYLRGKSQRITIPINPCFLDRGTPLQKQLWQLLTTIPYGETRTYGQLAMALGNRRLCRAIGQACKANPLALIFPCHRVVAAQAIGGFAGGVWIKEMLLALERENAD